MTIRATILATSALLALAGCGRSGETNQAAPANTMATTEGMNDMAAATPTPAASPAQSFANAAAASDTFEIESSKLALTNGSSASVKSFAQKMIDAHTASTAKLKTAAGSASPAITPDPTLNAEQQQKLDQMKGLTGTAFDQAYIAAQSAGHQQTLDTLKAYAATGESAPLKTFATGLIPTVTAHLNMTKALKA
jgi:putative membrane protein